MTAALAMAPAPAASLSDTFFHTRDNPWYGCGTMLEDAPTVTEALKASGLDWDVDMRPLLYRRQSGHVTAIKDRFVTVRRDTDGVLGQVGRNYRIWQNREAFAFANALVDDGGLTFDSAGSYRGQRRVFLVAKLPGTIMVAGDDPYELYLILVTSHDGTLSITAYVTPVRLACTNMMPLSLRNAVTRWSIRHTSTAEGHLLEARDTLKLTFKAERAFEKEMEALMSRSISDTELRLAVRTVLPTSPHVDDKVEQVVTVLHESGNLGDYRKTRYGGLQAFSEWLDWGREVRSDEARFQVSFDGYGSRQRNRLYRLLAA